MQYIGPCVRRTDVFQYAARLLGYFISFMVGIYIAFSEIANSKYSKIVPAYTRMQFKSYVTQGRNI